MCDCVCACVRARVLKREREKVIPFPQCSYLAQLLTGCDSMVVEWVRTGGDGADSSRGGGAAAGSAGTHMGGKGRGDHGSAPENGRQPSGQGAALALFFLSLFLQLCLSLCCSFDTCSYIYGLLCCLAHWLEFIIPFMQTRSLTYLPLSISEQP